MCVCVCVCVCLLRTGVGQPIVIGVSSSFACSHLYLCPQPCGLVCAEDIPRLLVEVSISPTASCPLTLDTAVPIAKRRQAAKRGIAVGVTQVALCPLPLSP